jgi:hypothetical protein
VLSARHRAIQRHTGPTDHPDPALHSHLPYDSREPARLCVARRGAIVAAAVAIPRTGTQIRPEACAVATSRSFLESTRAATPVPVPVRVRACCGCPAVSRLVCGRGTLVRYCAFLRGQTPARPLCRLRPHHTHSILCGAYRLHYDMSPAQLPPSASCVPNEPQASLVVAVAASTRQAPWSGRPAPIPTTRPFPRAGGAFPLRASPPIRQSDLLGPIPQSAVGAVSLVNSQLARCPSLMS